MPPEIISALHDSTERGVSAWQDVVKCVQCTVNLTEMLRVAPEAKSEVPNWWIKSTLAA
jgi:hypothetical protein